MDITPVYLAHLYACEGLSTYRVAGLTGTDRQRVTRALRRAGVRLRPRGTGRRRPTRRQDDLPDIEQLVAELDETARLTSREIGVLLGMPERTVRDRLRRYGLASAPAADGAARNAGPYRPMSWANCTAGWA
jgi:hypothetical protein